ncbi:S41A2-like protein [Mya arenaria]|uniref:S41A2-like protein n=1 Tax=Mya arenaria TaxID=6604 RepID=A0ABY7FXM0_MYAAR|nr:S41A2-like protein [Mya arenaria]
MSRPGRENFQYTLRSRKSRMVPYIKPDGHTLSSSVTMEEISQDDLNSQSAVQALAKDHANGKEKRVYRTKYGLVNSVPGSIDGKVDTVGEITKQTDNIGAHNSGLTELESLEEERSGANDKTQETSFINAGNGDTQPLLQSSGSEGEEGETIIGVKLEDSSETSLQIMLQVTLPYIIAGFGMVAAGMVLDTVQHWPVFVEVSEIFVLVPALLGLKGNLEMTLASRLSTQAQAIVVGFLASMFAMVMGWIPEGKFNAV